MLTGLDRVREWWTSEVSEGWDLHRSVDELEEVYDLGEVVAAVIQSVDVGTSTGIEVVSRAGGL